MSALEDELARELRAVTARYNRGGHALTLAIDSAVMLTLQAVLRSVMAANKAEGEQ